MGHNTLGGVAKKLWQDAGIQGNFTNHSLRATTAGLFHRSRVTGHRSRVTGHGSQVADHRSRVTGHGSQVAGHRSRVTGHGSQVAGHGLFTLYTRKCLLYIPLAK